MLNPRQIFAYFLIYRKYVGRRLILVFLLTFLAALVEGFGITLVLPLIASLDESIEGATGEELSGAAAHIHRVTDFLGLSGSTLGIIGFIAVLIALKGLIRFTADGYGAILSAQLQREIKGRLFDSYARMDYAYYTARHTGHFINLMTVQVNKFVFSFGSFKTVLSAILTTVVYLGVAFLIDWRFALMATLAGGSILLLFRKLNAYVKTLSLRTSEEVGNLNKFLVQSMQGYKYAASTASLGPLRFSVNRSIALLTRYLRNQGLAGAFTASIREPISIGVILAVMVVQLYFFAAPLAPILVSLILLYRAMGNFMLLQGNWQHFMNEWGAVKMLEEEFAKVAVAQERIGGQICPPFNGEIVFKDVEFGYRRKGALVIGGINLTIPARQTVAIVGPSGAGKSTLVDLLTGLLHPTGGDILIDGQSLTSLDLNSWRTQIGYVPQDTVIFDDSVANNIGLWKGDYGKDAHYREKIIAAAEQAFAREFIEALPQGFETRVGDRGIQLSGGQKQRLFIARELFKQPRLLILDEATSALDSESERAIQESIEKQKGSMTIVLIAHRLSTIRESDILYVLESGRIIEKGKYEDILAVKNSKLSQMVALQNNVE